MSIHIEEDEKIIDLGLYRRSKEEMREFDEFLQSIVVLKNRDYSELPECGIELIIDHGVDSPYSCFGPEY